ncbi:hypothetical protein [Planosporangium mesophilum]|uniref:hypothetical protein n=1 Tax=Planosporangium mesophilum TaxID=689768 RepID=UPI00143C928A|nr:hypothetical protein [Planosporangium mesophilum]NJC83479.1 hypothetical protein [Planosporangium mesophilum]
MNPVLGVVGVVAGAEKAGGAGLAGFEAARFGAAGFLAVSSVVAAGGPALVRAAVEGLG